MIAASHTAQPTPGVKGRSRSAHARANKEEGAEAYQRRRWRARAGRYVVVKEQRLIEEFIK
jgi:hypothetical protein